MESQNTFHSARLTAAHAALDRQNWRHEKRPEANPLLVKCPMCFADVHAPCDMAAEVPPKVGAEGQLVVFGPYKLTKQAAWALSDQLRQTADGIREPGCTDAIDHWEGHCGCKGRSR